MLIVSVRPSINLMALTIEQVIAKMQRSHTQLIDLLVDNLRFAGIKNEGLVPLINFKTEAENRDATWYNSSKNYREATNSALDRQKEVFLKLVSFAELPRASPSFPELPRASPSFPELPRASPSVPERPQADAAPRRPAAISRELAPPHRIRRPPPPSPRWTSRSCTRRWSPSCSAMPRCSPRAPATTGSPPTCCTCTRSASTRRPGSRRRSGARSSRRVRSTRSTTLSHRARGRCCSRRRRSCSGRNARSRGPPRSSSSSRKY